MAIRRRKRDLSRAFWATVEFADGQKIRTVIRGSSRYEAAEATRKVSRTDGTRVVSVDVHDEIVKADAGKDA